MSNAQVKDQSELCSQCLNTSELCVCAEIAKVSTKTQLLILQHPQEINEPLSTARLTAASLPNSKLKIGLSWKNLSHALGSEAVNKEWLVLYLGSSKVSERRAKELALVDRKGNILDNQKPAMPIKGLVILDGTWSQAKALWWRNAWLLKLQRAILTPQRPSLYGKLRREPRRECLSTIESAAIALSEIETNPKIKEQLLGNFQLLLKKLS